MQRLDLLAGRDIQIGKITVKHPTIREIIYDVGESFYLTSVGLFINKPSDMMVQLCDIGLDYTKMTPYDLFILSVGQLRKKDEEEIVKKQLNWLLGIDDFVICKDKSEIFLYSKKSKVKLDKALFLQIRKCLLDMNIRNDKEKFNPANEGTKKAIIDEERRKLKRAMKKERDSILVQQISSLVWGNTNGFKYDDILDLHVFQFYDGIFRINKIKAFEHINFGYYSGNITQSNFDKIKEKIDWMGCIND